MAEGLHDWAAILMARMEGGRKNATDDGKEATNMTTSMLATT